MAPCQACQGPAAVQPPGRRVSGYAPSVTTPTGSANRPRILVLIGSGEMAPQMARVHRSVIGRLAAGRARGTRVKAAVLDTPYGFQENSDALSAEALDFFGRRLGMDASLASFLRADANAVSRASAYARVTEADFVFSGPGSPSYALSQWSASQIPTLLSEKLLTGGALVMASAAALTLGRVTAPIYEIFKAGDDPRWLPGLDVLSAVGITAAVIPHWDNSEGSGHDTRFCFLGERRFARLEAELPPDVYVLGIDEHTALVIDLVARLATVRGRGNVTIRRGGVEQVFPAGEALPLDAFAASPAVTPASDHQRATCARHGARSPSRRIGGHDVTARSARGTRRTARRAAFGDASRGARDGRLRRCGPDPRRADRAGHRGHGRGRRDDGFRLPD